MYRATKALIFINAIMGLIALVGFAYSIAIVVMKGKLCIDCFAIPVIWGWTVFGLTLGIFLVSTFAIIAAARHVKSMLIFMSFFTFITFAASVALTVVIMLWSTASGLGALTGAVLDLENSLKSFLARWAIENPPDWLALQSGLKCCGVDLKAAYVHDTWRQTIHTGPNCNDAVDARIQNILNTFSYSFFEQVPEQLQAQLDAINALNGGKAYFCEAAAREAAKGATIIIGSVLSVLSALQLLAFGLSTYLLCGVSKEDGGFAEVDETGQLQSPLKAFIQAPAEVVHDTRAFANRVSTRIGMSVAPVANRVSTRMGFSPFMPPAPPGDLAPIGGPPPGMPPPGMGFSSGGGGGGGQKEWGEEYAKYVRMKKSGLPAGAVRNAMERDQVPVPDGFFDDDDLEAGATGNAGSSKPPPPPKKAFGAPPSGPPPFQAMRNLASRVSMNLQKSTNRVSMNFRGLMSGGGFAPPPPPPGFGELPPEGMSNSFQGATSFGGATTNPSFGAIGGGPSFASQPVPEEAPRAAPPPAKAAPPPKASKPAKPAKAKPEPKPAKGKKVAASGGGGGAKGFLADISGAGGSGGASAFGLKKTVTNDRSAPNFNA